jgi:hypothetical protein
MGSPSEAHDCWKTECRRPESDSIKRAEGPTIGEMVKAYTEQFLVPTLKRDDIVFMDNVRRS